LEDIPLLVNHFLDTMAEKKLPVKTLSRQALSRLLSYDWPGNVRELEHVLEQATVTTCGPLIEPENLPPQIVARHDEPLHIDFDHRRPLPEITAEFTSRIERAYLQRVLETYRGRVELCARHCGLSRRSISEKLRRYQIDKRDFKPHSSRRRQMALAGEFASLPAD
jgi:two-component system response regulator AtoC